MICSPPRRGSRASWRSPRATFRPATGSASAAPSRRSAHGAALISWSGSMFEYLMPSLVMRAPAGSLIEQTSRLIVRRQIDYGATLGVPWGISESAYNVRDLEFTYQYSNFGVPGLGLKRGLGENVVIAPYATALASHGRSAGRGAQLRPARRGRRARPLRLLRGAGLHADPGAGRQDRRDRAGLHGASSGHDDRRHRQCACSTARCGRAFMPSRSSRRRNCCCRSARRVDVAVARPWAAEVKSAAKIREVEPPGGRRLITAHSATPATHLLSNGRYAVMLTAAGSGYSRWRDLAVTRWREDATCDDWGSYVFLQRRRQRRRMVGGLSAERRRARRLRGHLQRRSRRVHASRRNADDDHGGARLGRRRCRGPSRLDLELRQPRAGDRSHVLCRARAGAPGRRRRASGLLQAVRRDRISGRRRRHSGDAAAAFAERAGDLGCASRRRRRRGRRKAGDRNRQGPVPRPRRQRPDADRGDRRSAALEHGRHRARSGLRPAPARADRTRRDRARRLLDGGRIISQSTARPRRQASRHHRLRAGGDARLDPGPGAAPSSRHRCGRGGLFQRLAGHLIYCSADAAAFLDTIRRGVGAQSGLVAAGHFRRPADRAAAHRRHREPRRRPPAAAGARILADEAARRRSRDPERARVLLCAGPSDRARDTGADEPVTATGRRGGICRAASSCFGRPDFGGDTRPSRVGGAGGARRTTRASFGSARPCSGAQRPCPTAFRSGLPAVPSRGPCRLCRTSSSSTGLAASPTMDGNM